MNTRSNIGRFALIVRVGGFPLERRGRRPHAKESLRFCRGRSCPLPPPASISPVSGSQEGKHRAETCPSHPSVHAIRSYRTVEYAGFVALNVGVLCDQICTTFDPKVN